MQPLALSGDDQHLVSGCVSSKVVGWDPATGQVKFSLQANQSRGGGPASPVARLCNTNFDNSVNSLAFGSTGPHRFVSGIRAGTVRFWDARCLAAGASFTLQAHDWKLNKVELGQNDTMLLTLTSQAPPMMTLATSFLSARLPMRLRHGLRLSLIEPLKSSIPSFLKRASCPW